MKKRFVLVMLMAMTCLTGCVEYKATMDIKSDKSMKYSVDYAIDTTVFGEEEIMDSEDKKKLEKEGFAIEPYEHDNMKGYHINKSIKNIDAFSSKDDVKYNLSGILNEETQDAKIFRVKKGLFKNTYYANFEFDASDSGLSDNEGEEPKNDEEGTSDEQLDDESLNDLTDSLMNNLDLSFNIKLPSRAISHNAQNVNNDGKELKWNLSTNSVDNISFSFSIYNIGNIILCIFILVTIVVAVVMFVKRQKNLKKSENIENIVREE